MSKTNSLNELLNINIVIGKNDNRIEVSKIFVYPTNFKSNKEFCDEHGLSDFYDEKAYKNPNLEYSLLGWVKKERSTSFILDTINCTDESCKELSPIVRQVQFINSLCHVKQSYSKNKYMSESVSDLDSYVKELVKKVNILCENPWKTYDVAIDREKLKKKSKK